VGSSIDTLWYAALADLLDRSHHATGAELPAEINAALRPLGVTVTIYLVDHEQRRLRPVPEPGRAAPASVSGSLPVDEGPAGEAYTAVSTVADPPGTRLWIALVDGTERLGVVEIAYAALAAGDPGLPGRCARLVGLIGHLVATKSGYGDDLAVVRRSRPMSTAAELLLCLMPPLTFSSRRMVVSAVLEPAYECGGDAFDYAVGPTRAYLATLDAMGHGLRAGLGGAVVLAATRACRRAGAPIEAAAREADSALAGQFDDLRFVTGVLADLDLDTGRLRYLNAGHPEPLLLRGGKVTGALSGGRQLPLGLGGDRTEVTEEALEPGDRLLFYTDGAVEAPAADGRPLGLDRLIDLVEETAFAGLPTPEALRRLTRNVLTGDDPPRDDATLMLVEWPPDPTERNQP
jgi:hypothetical protein